MGIHLYFSNQLIPLAERLQANLRPDKGVAVTLQPAMVVVPNMNLSKWLKLTLARNTAVCMNLDFQYLEAGLWQMLRKLDPRPERLPERVEKDLLTLILFFILLNLDPASETPAVVQRYLHRSTDEQSIDAELRALQLAETLARLFQEYEYHRADMIQRWLGDDTVVGDAMENGQCWLYRKTVAFRNALGDATGRSLVTLCEYAHHLFELGRERPLAIPESGERVHLFGLSQISPLHVEILSRLDPHYDIYIYSLNPSREYWEDIKTPTERKWIQRRSVTSLKPSTGEWAAGDLFSQPDHPLLSAWGKPGRENIRLLCQLTDYDFFAGFEAAEPPESVLAAIRHGILTLSAPPENPQTLPQDRSLQITACPGIRREVESVYHSILHNLAADDTLCMTDIAVMVSDMTRYKPVVDAVFSRQPQRITYNLVDAHARTDSVFAQAVLALMALAQSNFSRKAVFELLHNPCVMQKWDYGPEALTIWIDWADRLGIFHGFTKPAESADGGPTAGRYSWRQGMERMRLARIMTAPVDAEGCSAPHFHGLVPFANIHTGDDRLLEKFCTLITHLWQSVHLLQIPEASAETWRQIFFNVLDTLVAINDEMHGEETVYQSLVDAFDRFLQYDLLAPVEGGRQLTPAALWAFVRAHLDGISGGRGDYLTGGVTVSALMPMRPIPFKVVYVLGLEEGHFPGRAPASMLDLRNRQRRIGDVTPTERNRYLFLEILISVRSRLYLSYVCRDLQKDRDLAPCSVLLQLQRHVEQDILGGQPFKVAHIPIRADSPDYLAPGAINDRSDIMARTGDLQRLSCLCRYGGWDGVLARATTDELSRICRYTPDFSFAARAPADVEPEVLPIPIALLRRFLLDPVDVVGRYQLGIEDLIDPTNQLAERTDEPLSSEFPVDYRLRSLPIQHWLASQPETLTGGRSMDVLERLFDDLYADLSRRSLTPQGAFASQDHDLLKEQVSTTGRLVEPYLDAMRQAQQCFSAVTVGTVMDDVTLPGGHRLHLSPVAIDLSRDGPRQPSSAQLTGSLPWIWQQADNTWHCLVLSGSNRKSRHPDKYVLGPLLTLLAICAGGEVCPWSSDNRMQVHVIYREHVLDLDYRLDRRAATDYLTDLIDAYLTTSPLLWLPFETVFGARTLRERVARENDDPLDREAFYLSMIDAMQAETNLMTEMTGAVVTPDILDHARRRFAVFLPDG